VLTHDKIIIGGGFYGLYSALFAAQNDDHILLLEQESSPFARASYINQARVHMGYHYPRSISTALKSKAYFDHFNRDFSFCVADEFDQIYSISSAFSWTDVGQFAKFCLDADIFYSQIYPELYFKPNMCDGAFLTKEYAYDANILKEYLIEKISGYSNIELIFGIKISHIENNGEQFIIKTDESTYSSGFILNATYASVNQIHALLGYEPFKIKYELCEIILCSVSDNLKNLGLTVMDGMFFSIMPFGKTGYHSLTSVSFTPHQTSYDVCPILDCQKASGGYCSPGILGNCNLCPAKPQTAYPHMSQLAKKYLRDEFKFEYEKSLFSVKPILKTSEIDDSRPTVIRKLCNKPVFYSVLSGKINTFYDLEGILA